MFYRLIAPDIKELVTKKDFQAVKSLFNELLPQDIASIFNFIEEDYFVVIFRLIPSEKILEVFSELNSNVQEYILRHFGNKEIKEIINELEPDDRTALFEELPGEFVQKLLTLLNNDEREKTLELLNYPEDSVGRLMTPEYVAIRPDWTIEQVFQHIRKFGKDAETINMIYVVDNNWKLLDDIPIRRFFFTELNSIVKDIMDYSFVSILVTDDQEKAYNIVKKYNLTVLPVIDKNGILLGIVTVDDLIDISEEEVNEDFQKSSAISPMEEKYYSVPIFTLYRKRVCWLLILLVADFLSSSVIAHFENSIKTVIALAFFIPVLIDSGGNISSQSATLVIRALTTGELTVAKWFGVVKKELIIGLMIGLTLGLLLYIRGFFWRGGATVGLVVGVSMVAIGIWSNLLGGLLPILLTKFKLDPAVISAPLLTTVIDSTGLIIYFTLAGILFHL